jgi:outer membrane scaffolding protein for murein synthesis (MipA/OmpV family)
MSFQAYLDNIQARTGLGPAEFLERARAKGLAAKGLAAEGGGMAAGIKAAQITDWLKAEYKLGHGHAMAIAALIKGKAA